MIRCLLVCWLCLWASLAGAQPELASEAARQRGVVDRAAAAVADARAAGAKRTEVADLLKVYREEAAALEALEQARAPSLQDERRVRLAAIASLSDALAEGKESEAHEVLEAWLGPPAERVAFLDRAVVAGMGAPEAVRQALLLDVAEQADALTVWLGYDAAVAQRRADQLTLRALALRRRGPGQAGSMAAEVDAVRLEAEAAELRRDASTYESLRQQVRELRQRVAAALEEP